MDENQNCLHNAEKQFRNLGMIFSDNNVGEFVGPSQAFECDNRDNGRIQNDRLNFEKLTDSSVQLGREFHNRSAASSISSDRFHRSVASTRSFSDSSDKMEIPSQVDVFSNFLHDYSKLPPEQKDAVLSHLQALKHCGEPAIAHGNGFNTIHGSRNATSSDSIGAKSSLSYESIGSLGAVPNSIASHDVLNSPAVAFLEEPNLPNIWTGELPPRNYVDPTFSCKFFVGGVPWDISEEALIECFCPYGKCRVEWPGKEPRYSRTQVRDSPKGRVSGYVYMIFEQERSVKTLLQDCSQEFGSAGEWYFKLKAKRGTTTEIRQVQIIPWVTSDSVFFGDPSCPVDTKKTVFVGALHGMITAQILFSIMNEFYGDVVCVGIDTDKYKYPIGSGRVTFRSHKSYFKAIESAYLEVRTSKFVKKVQIDPFLEDSSCMKCHKSPGHMFCRHRQCFSYLCYACWKLRHRRNSGLENHRPLMRNAPRSEACSADRKDNATFYREKLGSSIHNFSISGTESCKPAQSRVFPQKMFYEDVGQQLPSSSNSKPTQKPRYDKWNHTRSMSYRTSEDS